MTANFASGGNGKHYEWFGVVQGHDGARVTYHGVAPPPSASNDVKRSPDYTGKKAPPDREGRVAALRELFGKEVYSRDAGIVCRVGDDGSVDGWLLL
jgi:hypothetical protein